MTRQGFAASSTSLPVDREHVLETAREKWLIEQPDFDDFGNALTEKLRAIARGAGISVSVSYRTKSMDSLIKKLIRKDRHTYETLGDKVGARVVVRHRHEVTAVVERMRACFACSEPDDKSGELGDDRVGYQSVHIEVELLAGDNLAARFEPGAFKAEIQVRTLAQHLWSEMSHDMAYKSDVEIPQPVRRRVNLLAGLIELADNEFSRLEQEVSELPGMTEIGILKALERSYYQLTSRPADRILSLDVIRLLEPLYDSPPPDWGTYFDELFRSKKIALQEIFEMANDNPARSAFLFQPEVLMIYDQLGKDASRLRQTWAQEFPERELERLAAALGFSLA